jgi:ankyrin repeat protein
MAKLRTVVIGRNVLFYAIESGQIPVAAYLIEAGSRVNIKTRAGLTPLRIATQRGYHELIGLLLARGAYPDDGDRNGVTPLKGGRPLWQQPIRVIW